MIINYLSTLAPTVILVTHLKALYIGQAAVPGKQVPANSNALDRTMRMRLWLRLNPSGRPVPIGLIMKRLDKKVKTDSGLRTENVLPRKIVPAESEHSLWDTIWRYWDNPMGDREPEVDELPNEYEMSILDGTLTKDQARTLTILAQSGLMEEVSMDVNSRPTPEELAKIIQLQDEGLPINVIAKQVNLPLVRLQEVLDRLPPAGEEVDFGMN